MSTIVTACLHPGGFVLPERGDGLHWLRCVACGAEWAEDDSGKMVRALAAVPEERG